MEGPSPVSALIHAATMVTAGIFLVVRSSTLFEFSPASLFYTTLLGATTAIFGGSCAVIQYDIKKVIAYSTCSQLGYMLICCGLSEYSTSLYHLVNHAFFKALLFLTAGNIIHSVAGEQDIRRMGGLSKILPSTYSLFLLGSLSLMGIPYLSGFFSKDFIIELALNTYTIAGGFTQLIVLSVTAITAFYSTRLLYLVFFGRPRGFRQVFRAAHESSSAMLFPLVLLAIGAIISGYL
jgi:NADH:ubiquinone oxidoreductase subunit 5 (subunit L)/multisubunit Na+/H+ antiporter MnhA subunit